MFLRVLWLLQTSLPVVTLSSNELYMYMSIVERRWVGWCFWICRKLISRSGYANPDLLWLLHFGWGSFMTSWLEWYPREGRDRVGILLLRHTVTRVGTFLLIRWTFLICRSYDSAARPFTADGGTTAGAPLDGAGWSFILGRLRRYQQRRYWVFRCVNSGLWD